MARPRKRPSAPADTRTRILAAAAAEFGARGFAATTVDAVALRARVNKAMIYYHFKDKRALYAVDPAQHLGDDWRAPAGGRGPAAPAGRSGSIG